MRPVAAFLVVVTALLSLLGYRLYEQNAELHGPAGGAGTIEGEAVLVSARIGARVQTLAVEKGQEVEAGALLMTLDCAEPEAALAEAEARLAMAEAQERAAASTARATARSGDASRRQSAAQKAQAEALAVRQEKASRSAERLESVGEGVSVEQREAARSEARGLEQQVVGATASSAAAAAQAAAAADQGKAAEANAEAASQSVRAAQAAVERARLQVAECQVHAPTAGFVETLPWHVGELVGPGVVLARIVDIHEVKATFYLPNAEIGAVTAGAKAEVIADAYPDAVFEGTVSTVALVAEFTPRNVQTRSDRDKLVYPVEVRIPNADGRLRPGMPVQVSLPGTGR